MKQNFFSLSLILSLVVGISACSKDSATLKNSAQEEIGQGFTLTASYGSPETRATFDDDGLGTTWQPGDCLYLIDVSGKNSMVKLTTNITEPSKSASFTTTFSVLSGTYLVTNVSSKSVTYPEFKLTDLSQLSSSLLFYGTLAVEDGQTSASISLKHAYSKLTFKYKNVPSGATMHVGMAVSEEGFRTNTKGNITVDGLQNVSCDYSLMKELGTINTSSTSSAILMEPIDLSDKKVFVFAYYRTSTSAPLVCYEFIKNGIDLKAGRNYNITLDMDSPTNKSNIGLESGKFKITNAAEFRAVSYFSNTGNSATAMLKNDINFTNEQCFPILGSLSGGGHKISNINMSFNKLNNIALCTSSCSQINVDGISVIGNDYVGGIAAYNGTVSKCCVSNATISGHNYVGALSGSASSIYESSISGVNIISGPSYVGGFSGSCPNISDSKIEGNLTVTGTKKVGGFVGDGAVKSSISDAIVKVSGNSEVGGVVGSATAAITSCSLKKSHTIEGKSSIGGICGVNNYSTTQCHISDKCTITGETSVGGICGSGISISKCIVKGEITVSGSSYIGGLVGTSGNISESGFEGNVVSTAEYAGGIAGHSSGIVDKCYVKGNIKGSTRSAGIVGGFSSNSSGYYVKNSYIIGDVESTYVDSSIAGIVGFNGHNTRNCYQYGNVSSGYGISYSLSSTYYNYNLTSMSQMYSGANGECNCGPNKTYLSLINVINGEEAYSTQVWPNIDAKCPLLQWQAEDFGGDVDTPDFGDEDW